MVTITSPLPLKIFSILIVKRFAEDPELTNTLYFTPSHLTIFSNARTNLDWVRIYFFFFNSFITALISALRNYYALMDEKISYYILSLFFKIFKQYFTSFIAKIKRYSSKFLKYLIKFLSKIRNIKKKKPPPPAPSNFPPRAPF